MNAIAKCPYCQEYNEVPESMLTRAWEVIDCQNCGNMFNMKIGTRNNGVMKANVEKLDLDWSN